MQVMAKHTEAHITDAVARLRIAVAEATAELEGLTGQPQLRATA